MAYGRKGVNWGVIVTAIILIGIVVFFAFATEGFKNWNPKTWFQPVEEQPSGQVTDGDGNAIETGKVYPLQNQLVYSRMSDESSVTERTLKATVTPAGSSLVDWSVAWSDSSAAWAAGKTVSNYMTVTPLSSGSLTATVSCSKAFGEKIKIRVTSREDSAVFAECIVDFRQFLVTVNVTLGNQNTTVCEWTAENTAVVKDYSHEGFTRMILSASGVWSTTYTLAHKTTVISVAMVPTLFLDGALSTAGLKSAPRYDSGSFVDYFGPSFYTAVTGTASYTSAQVNSVVNAMKGLSGQALYFVSAMVDGEIVVRYSFQFNMATANLRVESVSLDNGTMEF